MTEQQYIRGIREGKMRVFERFYDEYKSQFIAFMLGRMGVESLEHAEDLYRMACAHLYNNIRAGKFVEGDAQLKTYLNQIGKYTLLSERRKRETELVFEKNNVLTDKELERFVEEDNPHAEKLVILRKTVELMPEPCAKLLDYRIYQEKGSKEIARLMGYKNESSVTTQVHKCREKLITTVRKRFKMYGYEC